MKIRTWFIILIVLIVILIGWSLLFKKTEAPAVPPASSTTTTTTTTSSAKGSTTPSRLPGSPAVIPNTIRLGGGQHVSTTKMVVGQHVIVTVTDPIDAGYVIDAPQYDSAIIGLANHTHTPGANTNGTDTYEFVALKTGTTGITITATQSTNKNSAVILFSNAVSVK
ncbi:MAG TPA: hypothetical protein VL576_00495 [Candidatus Paceibacterota bacterium]|nr:hypothetical protein [Candidatus Paceibacterota bacterium]